MNMGAWTFMEPRLRDMNGAIKYIGRDASASPAAGSYKVHQREQKALVEAAVSGRAGGLDKSMPKSRSKNVQTDGADGRAARAKRR
jgi:2-oxoglutarate dehydrogenase E1 component